MVLGRLFLAALLPLLSSALPVLGQDGASPTLEDTDVFSGVIESIDRDASRMTVMTDIGRSVPFTVANPDLIIDLQPGERVSVELDDHRQASKITRMAPPELLKPPSGGS